MLKRDCLSASPNLVPIYQQTSGGGDCAAYLRIWNKIGKRQGQVFGCCGVGAGAGFGVLWACVAGRLARAELKFADEAPLCSVA